MPEPAHHIEASTTSPPHSQLTHLCTPEEQISYIYITDLPSIVNKRSIQTYITKRQTRSIYNMAEATAPKPSSSVKLVLLGEAAVGKVRI
jgi:hypothetical protein